MSSFTTTKILRKWRKQGSFVQWIDGDCTNNSAANLRWISIKDAIEHFDDWRTDWDMELTEKEIAIVKDPKWRSGLRFTVTE